MRSVLQSIWGLLTLWYQSRLLLRSAPELPACQRRALRKRFEFGPGDLRVNAPAETTVGRSDDPLPADDIGEAQDALGDEFRVFDNIGGVADDARQDQLVVRQLHILPDLPFV